MLDFEQVGADGAAFIYAYFPEGDRGDRGTIRFDPGSGEFEVRRLAKADRRRRYALHLVYRLRESTDGEMPKSGMCAWY